MKGLLCIAAAMVAFSAGAASARTILFIGNSFTMRSGSPAHYYQADTTHALEHVAHDELAAHGVTMTAMK